jgi:hypothetical protein
VNFSSNLSNHFIGNLTFSNPLPDIQNLQTNGLPVGVTASFSNDTLVLNGAVSSTRTVFFTIYKNAPTGTYLVNLNVALSFWLWGIRFSAAVLHDYLERHRAVASTAIRRIESPAIPASPPPKDGKVPQDMEISGATIKVSKASRGSPDPIRRKVERQDSGAGPLRGAHDSVCVDHRLRIGHQDHIHINEHVNQHRDQHIDLHGNQCVNDYHDPRSGLRRGSKGRLPFPHQRYRIGERDGLGDSIRDQRHLGVRLSILRPSKR